MEPLERPTALAIMAGLDEWPSRESPGANAAPVLTGGVDNGVSGTVALFRLGWRNSAALFAFRAVVAHPERARESSSNGTV